MTIMEERRLLLSKTQQDSHNISSNENSCLAPLDSLRDAFLSQNSKEIERAREGERESTK